MRHRSARLLSCVGALVVAASAALVGTPAGIDTWGTVRVGARPEPNAAIWLDAPGAAGPAGNTTVILDQRNQAFSPHLLVVRVGTRVELPNNDRVFHNVFSTSPSALCLRKPTNK